MTDKISLEEFIRNELENNYENIDLSNKDNSNNAKLEIYKKVGDEGYPV